MTAPHRYVLGGNQELDMAFKDLNGIYFVPNASRLSIKQPDGVIVTLSGGQLIMASGYLDIPDSNGRLISTYVSPYFYTLYRPPTTGWFEYESWVRDGTGREDTETAGFEVIDRVF
jgi:hypothetical protein